MTFNIDADNDDTTRTFKFCTNGLDGSGSTLLTIAETGHATFAGQVNVSGNLLVGDELGLFDGSTNASRYIDAGLGDNNTLFIRGCSGGDANHETLAQFTRNGACTLFYDTSAKIATTADGVTVTGTVSDEDGDLRNIPLAQKTSAYVLVAQDAGRAIHITTGGVTVNNSVFSAGNAVTIINDSGSDQTITQGSGLTMYNSADASTGNRTLAGRGMATIWFNSASKAYISGAGLS